MVTEIQSKNGRWQDTRVFRHSQCDFDRCSSSTCMNQGPGWVSAMLDGERRGPEFQGGVLLVGLRETETRDTNKQQGGKEKRETPT